MFLTISNCFKAALSMLVISYIMNASLFFLSFFFLPALKGHISVNAHLKVCVIHAEGVRKFWGFRWLSSAGKAFINMSFHMSFCVKINLPNKTSCPGALSLSFPNLIVTVLTEALSVHVWITGLRNMKGMFTSLCWIYLRARLVCQIEILKF